MFRIIAKSVTIAALCATFLGCSNEFDTESRTSTVAELRESADIDSSRNADSTAGIIEWTVSENPDVPADNMHYSSDIDTVNDVINIPYPVYPNGAKYRIGSENGLRVVLFESEDSFEEVDDFYQAQASLGSDLSRLDAMNDYVRYSTVNEDTDPWETSRPGIVIHQFNSESERDAVGASYKAKTNIIMSFE